MSEQKKIALFGPPLAGKATIVCAYARSRGLMTETGSFDRAASNSMAPPRIFRTSKSDKSHEYAQASTYWGDVWAIEDWEPLLRACNALLVVLDPQESRVDVDVAFLQFLRELRLNVKACILFTKSDLPLIVPAKELRRRLALDKEPFCDWPIYESTIELPDTMLAPIDYLSQD